eukprot:COSAG01_NODE_28_length_36622_cov_14.695751_23_plen_53_part_00
MWGVVKFTIKVLLCYLKQSTASGRTARPGLQELDLLARQLSTLHSTAVLCVL